MTRPEIQALKEKYSNFELKCKTNLKKKSDSKLSASTRKFLIKLGEENFSKFTSTDWIMYFQKKYEETNGRGYSIIGKRAWSTEHSIYKCLMKEFIPRDIKLMIDFVFDSNHDITSKLQVGSYMFSAKWIQGVYQKAKLWETGDYKTKDEFKKSEKRNREWTKSTSTEDNIEVVEGRQRGSITF